MARVTKQKVLIIEDEQTLREAYQRILSFNGYDVAVATNGREGLEILESFRPHLVMLDMLMPQLDGAGFIRESKLHQRYPDTKVIVCTNLSDDIASDFIVEIGSRQVLKSDLCPSELVNLVREVLALPNTSKAGA